MELILTEHDIIEFAMLGNEYNSEFDAFMLEHNIISEAVETSTSFDFDALVERMVLRIRDTLLKMASRIEEKLASKAVKFLEKYKNNPKFRNIIIDRISKTKPSVNKELLDGLLHKRYNETMVTYSEMSSKIPRSWSDLVKACANVLNQNGTYNDRVIDELDDAIGHYRYELEESDDFDQTDANLLLRFSNLIKMYKIFDRDTLRFIYELEYRHQGPMVDYDYYEKYIPKIIDSIFDVLTLLAKNLQLVRSDIKNIDSEKRDLLAKVNKRINDPVSNKAKRYLYKAYSDKLAAIVAIRNMLVATNIREVTIMIDFFGGGAVLDKYAEDWGDI